MGWDKHNEKIDGNKTIINVSYTQTEQGGKKPQKGRLFHFLHLKAASTGLTREHEVAHSSTLQFTESPALSHTTATYKRRQSTA